MIVCSLEILGNKASWLLPVVPFYACIPMYLTVIQSALVSSLRQQLVLCPTGPLETGATEGEMLHVAI